MAGFEVRAFNHATGDTAAILGPGRSRIKSVFVYATAVTTFQFKNGSAAGDVLFDVTCAAGSTDFFIPADGILAADGCFVSAMTGTGTKITVILG